MHRDTRRLAAALDMYCKRDPRLVAIKAAANARKHGVTFEEAGIDTRRHAHDAARVEMLGTP